MTFIFKYFTMFLHLHINIKIMKNFIEKDVMKNFIEKDVMKDCSKKDHLIDSKGMLRICSYKYGPEDNPEIQALTRKLQEKYNKLASHGLCERCAKKYF